jgi:predicted polyphosphate/ATP-dependent NAD kinase
VNQIGIIANPASGRDIRRLVAHGTVIDNIEKVNIVTRVILGAIAVGVEQIHIMPDTFGLGEEALRKVRRTEAADRYVTIVPMTIEGRQEDSTRAARYMEEMGVGAIVTLGGDGTNRAVSKGTVNVPIVPLSTGTNNVFPCFLEGTVAGIMATVAARGELDDSAFDRRQKMSVFRDGEPVDHALIDVVVTKSLFVGSRAVWDMNDITQVFLTQARPTDIGFSALGGFSAPICPEDQGGLAVTIGPGGGSVLAPIGPGLITRVPVTRIIDMHLEELFSIETYPSVVALDGEREITFTRHQRGEVALQSNGPIVINRERAMNQAIDRELFVFDKEKIEWQQRFYCRS